jgi:hypothetical protein
MKISLPDFYIVSLIGNQAYWDRCLVRDGYGKSVASSFIETPQNYNAVCVLENPQCKG